MHIFETKSQKILPSTHGNQFSWQPGIPNNRVYCRFKGVRNFELLVGSCFHSEIAEKSLFKQWFIIPAMPDYLKIHLIHFSVTLSGHNYLVFQGSLTPLCPCSSPFIRLPVIQGNSCPAFPIIISPYAWYCRPWSLTAYGYAPGLNRGNGTFSIRNTLSDRPPFVQFYSDYGRLVSLLQLLAFVSPYESMAHNSWSKLFSPVYS